MAAWSRYQTPRWRRRSDPLRRANHGQRRHLLALQRAGKLARPQAYDLLVLEAVEIEHPLDHGIDRVVVRKHADLLALELVDAVDCALSGDQQRQLDGLEHEDGAPAGGGRIIAAHHGQLGVLLAQRLGAGQEACGLDHRQLKVNAIGDDFLFQGR